MARPTARNNKVLKSLRLYTKSRNLGSVRSVDLECSCIDLVTDTLHYALDKGLCAETIIRLAQQHVKEERK